MYTSQDCYHLIFHCILAGLCYKERVCHCNILCTHSEIPSHLTEGSDTSGIDCYYKIADKDQGCPQVEKCLPLNMYPMLIFYSLNKTWLNRFKRLLSLGGLRDKVGRFYIWQYMKVCVPKRANQSDAIALWRTGSEGMLVEARCSRPQNITPAIGCHYTCGITVSKSEMNIWVQRLEPGKLNIDIKNHQKRIYLVIYTVG